MLTCFALFDQSLFQKLKQFHSKHIVNDVVIDILGNCATSNRRNTFHN